MLVKIFSTTTLILLAWLSVQMLQAKQSLDAAQLNFQRALSEVRAELDSSTTKNESIGTDLFARMDLITAEQVKLSESANKIDPGILKAKDRTITRMQETAELQNAFATVVKADLAAFNKQGPEAAELLKSTKSVIWKTSDKWAKSKDTLRELMAPIDILAGKWSGGDYSGSSKSIKTALITVLEAQSKP